MKLGNKLKHTRARRLGRAVLFSAIALTSVSVLSMIWRFNFWLELFSTYIPQIILVDVAALMLLFAFAIYINISEGWTALKGAFLHRLPLLLVLGILMTTIFGFPLSSPKQAKIEPTAESNFRALTFNKLYKNDNYTQITNYIHSRDPDVVGFQEIFDDEAEDLAKRLGYEFWHVASCSCSAYGSDLAIFSRFPIKAAEMSFEDKLGGVLRGEIELDLNKKLVVYVAHIVPPYSSAKYKIREGMLNELAAKINAEKDPVILMGDFNSTIYSIDMRRLATALSDISITGQRPWSKCSWNGYSDLLCARIDHIFVPNSSTIRSHPVVGPQIGSDHLPIDVNIAI